MLEQEEHYASTTKITQCYIEINQFPKNEQQILALTMLKPTDSRGTDLTAKYFRLIKSKYRVNFLNNKTARYCEFPNT